MLATSLTQILPPLSATLVGADVSFTSVSTDTRTLQPGALFVALSGENFDGHAFIDAAVAKGAVAAVVSCEVAATVPRVLVKNTRIALGQLAAWYRSCFNIPVIAITGNSGKTTVKEMTAAIFKLKNSVLVTQGNLNNEIGLPLTLLKLTAQHQLAILELGASRLGEIAYIAQLAKPQLAVITNVTGAHMAGFGTLENIAKAKGEIIQALPASGVAVLNRDDNFYSYWARLAETRSIISYGLAAAAEVRAVNLQLRPAGNYTFTLITPRGDISIQLKLLGQHNVMNALAAAAVAEAMAVDLQLVKQGLEQVKAVAGRLVAQQGIKGIQLLDDTYNANPGSVYAAIDVLATQAGKKILVLGDMAELGETAPLQHQQVGEYAKKKAIDKLLTLGALSAQAAMTFWGQDIAKQWAFSSYEELLSTLLQQLDAKVTVLVKGSRSAKMERVVLDLTQGIH